MKLSKQFISLPLSLSLLILLGCSSSIGLLQTNNEIVAIDSNTEEASEVADTALPEEASEQDPTMFQALCGTAPFSLTQNGLEITVWSSWVACKDPNLYVFDFGDGAISEPTPALTDAVHTYSKTGKYTIKVQQITPEGEKIDFLEHEFELKK